MSETADYTNQPKPIPNDHPANWDLVIADIQARDEMGARKYGTRLQAFNGRNYATDAYEEALDLVVYLKGLQVEHAQMKEQIAQLTRERDEERAIVDRIWDIFGRPSYQELKGRSIYDLINEAIQQRDELVATLEKALLVCQEYETENWEIWKDTREFGYDGRAKAASDIGKKITALLADPSAILAERDARIRSEAAK